MNEVRISDGIPTLEDFASVRGSPVIINKTTGFAYTVKDGDIVVPMGLGGSVTSVALTAPAQFSVGGSPVTLSGTLALSWASQSANVILAGPISGAIAAPTFRSLVTADYPDNTVTLAKLATVATASVLGRNTAGTGNVEVLATLPSAVQDNITRLGTIATGTWNGTLVGSTYGGTGANLSAGPSGGIPFFNALGVMGASALFGATEILAGGGAGNPPVSNPAFLVVNAGSGKQFKIISTAAGGQSDLFCLNNSGLQTQFGIFGSTRGAYGALASGNGYLYTNTTGVTVMADNAAGIFRIATGGNVEKWRVQAAGRLSNTGADGTANIHHKAGTATASTAPKKTNDGVRLTAKEVGTEVLEGNFYFTNWKLIQFPIGGPIFDHFADANNGTTVETDLYSDTLLANTFAINGDKVTSEYAGTFSGDATSTQRLRAYFGGTLIFDSGALAIGVATPTWDLSVLCMRESSSIVRCAVKLTTSSATLAAYSMYTKVTGLTLTNTQILKITGTAAGATGASNQITASIGAVEYKPAVN